MSTTSPASTPTPATAPALTNAAMPARGTRAAGVLPVEVTRVISRAGVRLWAQDWVEKFALVSAAGVAGVLVTRLVQQALGLALPWGEIALGVGAAALIVPTAWSLWARRDRLRVARELDEAAGLRESLSTAMCVAGSAGARDPWAQAVIDTARQRAAGLNIAPALPWRLPRRWMWAPGAGLALLVAWLTVPNLDLLGEHAERTRLAERERAVVEVQAQLKQNEDALQQLLAKARVQPEEEEPGADGEEQPAEATDPEALQRAAVRRLTNLTEQLQEKSEGEKAQQMEGLREALQQLRQPGPGPLDQFARSLSRGEFGQAQQQLQELAQKLGDGSMSEEQKEQVKKQLENLAQQLEKAAENQQELARQLERAGMNREQAQELARKAGASPEQLRQAIEQMQNLTPEQKQALQQMAQAASQAAQQCSGMSQGMSQMAQGMTSEGMSSEGMEGLQGAMGQLSSAEMMQAELDALSNALAEAQAQLQSMGQCMGEGMGNPSSMMASIGQWREGESNRFGSGSGGPGKGHGANVADSPTDFTVQRERSPVNTGAGPMIGTRLVAGDSIRGESRAEFAQAVEAGAQAAADAMETQQIPREMHEAVKRYFSTLDRRGATPAGGGGAGGGAGNTTGGAPSGGGSGR